jgi:branched-chain amino acid aminotransferase
MKVWFNGAIVGVRHCLDAIDRGFLAGDGVFETLLVRAAAPAFLSAHLARLRCGLAATGIDAAISESVVCGAILALSEANGVEGDGALRITVSRGAGGRGVLPPAEAAPATPSILMTLDRLPAPPARLSCMIVSQRIFSGRASAAFKAIDGYGECRAALREARAKGADEALMLNESGRLVCASAANVFLIFPDGGAATPPTLEGAMPGVVRSVLLRRAILAGAPIAERPIETSELAEASIALTNSLRGVVAAAGVPAGPAAARLAEFKSWYQTALEQDIGDRRKRA